jgi:hypothetical protein
MEGVTKFFSGNNLREAERLGMEAIIPDQQFRKRDAHFEGCRYHGGKRRFSAGDFEYDKKKNRYICSAGKPLEYKEHVKLNRNSGETCQAKGSDCGGCKLQEKCIASRAGGVRNGRCL